MGMSKSKRDAYLKGRAYALIKDNPTYCPVLLETDDFRKTDIQDRIDRVIRGEGWRIHPSSITNFARPKRKRGWYRLNSLTILQIITCSEGIDFLVPASEGLDRRYVWLLEKIYSQIACGTYELMFLQAIAKDAGVLPAPKWWKVTRRLLGRNPTFGQTSS
jgi:hypothetical protein